MAEAEAFPANFLRHYYDVYCLLALDEVQTFMREPAYPERKARRFRTGDEQVIARNPAFILPDADQRERFADEYRKTAALYHQGQPDFEILLERIHQHIDAM
nr:nucleotidyl transferase AbiEii/AbiGii toxin family protein [Burkholderia guangdongensis]